jgi:IPT/TIG domain
MVVVAVGAPLLALLAVFLPLEASTTAIYGPFIVGNLLSPTSCTVAGGGSGVAWTNPGNAAVNNSLSATSGSISTGQFAEDLLCTGYASNYPVTLPLGAFVSDVVATVDAASQTGKDRNRLRGVSLLGVNPGPAAQSVSIALQRSDTVPTRYAVPSTGSPNDWGGAAEGVTASAANAAAFGLRVIVGGAGNDNNGPGAANVWWVGMTISYEIRATVAAVSPSCVLQSALPTTISLQGTGFVALGAVRCRFGATEVAGTLVSDQQIDCVAPGALSSGFTVVEVSMDGGGLFSSNGIQLEVASSACSTTGGTTALAPSGTTATTNPPGTTGTTGVSTGVSTTGVPTTTGIPTTTASPGTTAASAGSSSGAAASSDSPLLWILIAAVGALVCCLVLVGVVCLVRRNRSPQSHSSGTGQSLSALDGVDSPATYGSISEAQSLSGTPEVAVYGSMPAQDGDESSSEDDSSDEEEWI